MKVLLIGTGGIGSWLIDLIQHGYDNVQINSDVEFHIADLDTISTENVLFQNFKPESVTEFKVMALANRYDCIAVPKKKEITGERDLKPYDFFILAVDNFKARELVYEYCHATNKQYIDLRAEGRIIMAKVKEASYAEDMQTLDMKDTSHGSCQRPADLNQNRLQYGNRIVAGIGMQMFLNYLRGITNKTIIQLI